MKPTGDQKLKLPKHWKDIVIVLVASVGIAGILFSMRAGTTDRIDEFLDVCKAGNAEITLSITRGIIPSTGYSCTFKPGNQSK